MADFKVDETGNVTLTFNVSELVNYADVVDTDEGMCPSHMAYVRGFLDTIAHMVEKKPSNWSMRHGLYLQKLGLKRFKVTSSGWHPLVYYCRDKSDAARLSSHLKGVKITEDKKWFENN